MSERRPRSKNLERSWKRLQTLSRLMQFDTKKQFLTNYKHLKKKSQRNKYNLFVGEGVKCVADLSTDFQLMALGGSEMVLSHFQHQNSYFLSEKELSASSHLKNNESCIAVFQKKQWTETIEKQSLTPVFEGLNNPGNLGAIIRTSAWFGIKKIVCSPDSVEVYNPKTVQAAMGTLGKVQVQYKNLESLLLNKDFEVVGTFPREASMEQFKGGNKPVYLVFGSESHGISRPLAEKINHKISIQSESEGVESLNIGVSYGILAHHFSSQLNII